MTDQAAPSTSETRRAAAIGLATIVRETGAILDTFYPAPTVDVNAAAELVGAAGLDATGTVRLAHAKASDLGGGSLAGAAGTDGPRGVYLVPVATRIDDLDAAPVDAHDAYLRLHLLSHRLVRPRAINLDGLFGVLNNVVWTSAGPCSPDGF